MIYLVSRNKSLFGSERYKQVPFEEAMALLLPLHLVQFDTETKGLDAHTKELLTVQLGCREFQVVFDWTTLNNDEKHRLKEYLESNRLFIGHNLMFDLTFLYRNDIWPKRIYDTMIAEQLLFLGYPRSIGQDLVYDLGMEFPDYEIVTNSAGGVNYELSYSLKATAKRRIKIDIDKDDSLSKNLMNVQMIGAHLNSNLINEGNYTQFTLRQKG